MALRAWKARIGKPETAAPPKQFEHALKRQLAWASGAEFFADRDPIYHISDSFRQTFALLGRRSADNALYTTRMEEPPGLSDGAEKQAAPGEKSYGAETLSERERELAQTRFYEKTSMDGVFAPASDREDFLRRFSETAFSRGSLAGAVMRGTGQMMLLSCLKRTAGQSQPKNFRQRMLFENASAKRNIKGHPPDKAVFNKGDTDSAIGLVVDVVRDARRVVESLTSLLENGFEGNPQGSGTLQKMYPFLSVAKEQALLTQYKDMLSALDGPESASKRQILQRAAAKTEALIAKKRQMRFAFLHHLRALSDQATVALHVFEQEGFRETVFAALTAPPPPPEKPEDGDGEKEDE